MNIPEFSVRNPILAWMLTIFVVVAGLWATFGTMSREVFPVTDLNLVVVRTIYPNASPAEVEEQITNLIEDEINGLSGINEYTSTSAEGVSVVIVQVDPDVDDSFRVVNDVQRRVDQIDEFPDEAEDPVVESITTDRPVINVCVSGSDERSLRLYGDDLERRLRRTSGVSTIDKTGWRDEEFWVEVDPVRLAELEVSLLELIASLRESNVTLPGGKMSQGSKDIILRTVGKFYTVDEIEAVVVRSNFDGHAITVADLARVQRAFEEDGTFTKVNGAFALTLGVKKKRSADTIDVVDAVKRIVAEEEISKPDGVVLTLVDDTSYYVKRRLKVLLNNGGIGLVMVIVCLLIAMNFRVAAFTALAIPFSFLTTLLLMAYFGITINLMTMFGLIIVLGMVVDDSIIVGENIFRHLEMGKDPKTAAIDGTTEVTGPVISTVLTTIAAFFPLMFAPDLYATYLGWLVIAVILCLVASLLECLFIMPSHIADFARPLRVPKSSGADSSGATGAPRAVTRFYVNALQGALRLRYLVLPGLIILALGVAVAVWPFVRLTLFPGDMIDMVMVHMEAPEGTSVEETDRRTLAVEAMIRELPDDALQDYVTYVGQQFDFEAGMQGTRGSHFAQTFIYLTPQNTRWDMPTAEIVAQLREKSARVEGFDRLSFELVKPGPPVGKPLEVRVQGRDMETLLAIKDEVQAYLGNQEGVADIVDDFGEGSDERHVVIDEAAAARVGLTVEGIARTVFAAYEGAEATNVREGKDELKVRVMLAKPYREDPRTIATLGVPNREGRLIDLGDVAALRTATGLPTVNHFNGERVITVGADIDEAVTTSAEVNRDLESHFADLSTRYPGFRLLRGGEWEETAKVMNFMKSALVIAMLMIYTILAVQFRSFLQPLVLLVPIPLSFVGVLLALILHGKPISIMAMLGFVGLGGVVVNDAIVLVNFINLERKRGLPLHEAIVNAGRMRLRPIILTSITTILGLLPVIYGIGGYEPFIAPAAIVLAFGLLFATYLTLIVVPVTYHIGADVKNLCKRVVSGSRA